MLGLCDMNCIRRDFHDVISITLLCASHKVQGELYIAASNDKRYRALSIYTSRDAGKTSHSIGRVLMRSMKRTSSSSLNKHETRVHKHTPCLHEDAAKRQCSSLKQLHYAPGIIRSITFSVKDPKPQQPILDCFLTMFFHEPFYHCLCP